MAAALAGLAFLFGASLGSFVNLVADRLPRGRSLLRPRSSCDACRTPLGPLDLVPVASYLALRGRCRHCRSPIPRRVLAVEVTLGLLFLALFLRHGLSPLTAALGAVVVLWVAIAVIDLEHGTVPDALLLAGLLLGLLLAPLWPWLGLTRPFPGLPPPLASLAHSLLAGGGAFLPFFLLVLAYPAGMGGGDVKLAGVLGLLLGFPGVAVAVWAALVAAGGVAAFLLATRRRGRKDPIPFAPFLTLGLLVAVMGQEEVVRLYLGLAERLGDLWGF